MLIVVLVVVLGGGGAMGAALALHQATKQAVVISDHGIGDVRLGLPRTTAIRDLTAIFGRSSPVAASADGCAVTAVAWKHLYAQFTKGRLAGYRYIEDGWPGKNSPPSGLPQLVTTRGITLGSTLAQARAAYPGLKAVGTNRWETPDGFVLWDNATSYPDPAASGIDEISLSNCGDF